MMKPSVFFYVQHLWGVGHVYRATRIARALADNNFDVHLVWGGTKIPGFDFTDINIHYLPAVRTSDASFNQLLHENYEPFTQCDEVERRNKLLKFFDDVNPDIVITEAFPFGRRQMLFELIPLLDRAKARSKPPIIAASIRDIMQEGRKEKRVQESVDFVDRYFDLVLVHGDPNMIEIGETLQGVDQFSDKIRYTGLVTPENIQPEDAEFDCDVLVSVGGGAFGQALTKTALEAMQYSKRFPKNWIISAGTELSDKDFDDLKVLAPQGMRIVRYIPDLANAMRHCNVSVSHSGYNTVADILRSGSCAVLYPYTGGKETEQLRRSQILANMKVTVHLAPDMLSAHNLAASIDQAAQLNSISHGLNLDGAKNTANLLSNSLKHLVND